MKTLLTSQQIAFFSQNGYIEFSDISFESDLLFSSIQKALPASPFGRDLWRGEKSISQLLLHTLSPVIVSLTRELPRLALDQWLLPENVPDHIASMKGLFCIQGLNLIAIFCETPDLIAPSKFPPSPFPSAKASVLFIQPHVLIDWAPLIKAAVPLYIAAYGFANQSVYILNPKDPATQLLRNFGYEYGDALRENLHPIVKEKRSLV